MRVDVSDDGPQDRRIPGRWQPPLRYRALPKDEVAKNTYDLFDLESGVPTDAYPLDEAIGDGYLTAPRGVSVPLKFVREGIRYEQFQKKTRRFLGQNLADGIVARIRSGEPITAADTRELQRVLVAAGVGDIDTFARASQRAGSFGLFIRGLVGFDRAAAERAFARFLNDKRYSCNQITFVNLIIDYLTQHGTIQPARVYESPFTSTAPEGPDAIFTQTDLTDLFDIIDRLHRTAAA